MQYEKHTPQKDKGMQPKRPQPGTPTHPQKDRGGSERQRQPEPPRRQQHGSQADQPFEEGGSFDDYAERPEEQPHQKH